jgi:hypothetical protein
MHIEQCSIGVEDHGLRRSRDEALAGHKWQIFTGDELWQVEQ